MQLNEVQSVSIKASTIQRQFPDLEVDDIYDIILGNILTPPKLVDEVLLAARVYDEFMEKFKDKE